MRTIINNPSGKPFCCHPECDADATLDIQNVAPRGCSPADYATQSCGAHVGYLLEDGGYVSPICTSDLLEPHEFDIQLRQDGNKWKACFHDFINLQDSPCAFGDTPEQAIHLLAAENCTPQGGVNAYDRLNTDMKEATAPVV